MESKFIILDGRLISVNKIILIDAIISEPQAGLKQTVKHSFRIHLDNGIGLHVIRENKEEIETLHSQVIDTLTRSEEYVNREIERRRL